MDCVQQYALGAAPYAGRVDLESSPGRPRASSRATLADAACELFLEQGYEQTSVADIARRAGVSRSSFFNYFSSKGDILWGGLDERIQALCERLADDAERAGGVGDARVSLRQGLTALGAGLVPDSLALAIVNRHAMGVAEELERAAALRMRRIAVAVSTLLEASGVASVPAGVAGAAHAGAVLAAIEAWARGGAGRAPLAETLSDALDVAAGTLLG